MMTRSPFKTHTATDNLLIGLGHVYMSTVSLWMWYP